MSQLEDQDDINALEVALNMYGQWFSPERFDKMLKIVFEEFGL